MARGRHYRRSSRLAGPTIVLMVAIVVGVGIGVGVWAATSDHHHTGTAGPGTVRTGAGPTASATAVPATTGTKPPPSSTAPTSSSPSTSSTTSPTTSTSATVPSPVVGAESITYTLPPGTTVKVTAINPCWVEVRASASAPVSQETILAAGQVITVPSPLWIRFGDPTSASASVGTTQLELPKLAGELIVVSPGTTP